MCNPNVYIVRNEVDPDCEYHCDALSSYFPTAEELNFVAGEQVPTKHAGGVVLTGSTAGVYESDRHKWITAQEALVHELVEEEIPTLGVCFGHQIINSALGGTVEHVGTTSEIVSASLADDPLFNNVDSAVVSLHGDIVTTPGENMKIIASADHAHIFATRHQKAPLWTVQFHPEITAEHRDLLIEDFEWKADKHSFSDVTADNVLTNFKQIVRRNMS
jgi:GMP synthase (glutamine-hydrolysing)